MFLFYALPAVPFMCLGLALVAGWVARRAGARRAVAARWGAAAVGGYLALVVVDFFYLYPVLAAQTLPYDAWRAGSGSAAGSEGGARPSQPSPRPRLSRLCALGDVDGPP